MILTDIHVRVEAIQNATSQAEMNRLKYELMDAVLGDVYQRLRPPVGPETSGRCRVFIAAVLDAVRFIQLADKPATLEHLTAVAWNMHPRNKIRVESWSDFGDAMVRTHPGWTKDTLMTWEQFRAIRSSGAVSVTMLVPYKDLTTDD